MRQVFGIVDGSTSNAPSSISQTLPPENIVQMPRCVSSMVGLIMLCFRSGEKIALRAVTSAFASSPDGLLKSMRTVPPDVDTTSDPVWKVAKCCIWEWTSDANAWCSSFSTMQLAPESMRTRVR